VGNELHGQHKRISRINPEHNRVTFSFQGGLR
jgi:hypothetical protein